MQMTFLTCLFRLMCHCCVRQSFPGLHVSGAALWAGPHTPAVVTPPSSPNERRHTAESRYRTSGGGEPGWASAFCVISIWKRVLTSESRAPPSGPSFPGVLPGGQRDARGQTRPFPPSPSAPAQILTEGGEGRGRVQDVPGKEVALGGRRPVGDEDVVMIIGSERERQSGHPGRVADVREEMVCRRGRSLRLSPEFALEPVWVGTSLRAEEELQEVTRQLYQPAVSAASLLPVAPVRSQHKHRCPEPFI